MEADQLEHFRILLSDKKADLQGLIRTMKERGARLPLKDSISELSSYDNHPADVASEVFERGKDLGLLDNLGIQLQKAEDALAAIDRGVYGSCEACGRPIPEERLEAAPETTLCRDCREEFEGYGDGQPRPIEEEVIAPPFGGNVDRLRFHLGGINTEQEYDGEDTWQDLARYTEHAEHSGAGSYYGDLGLDDENRGFVDPVDNIAYEVGDDGVFYQSFRSFDDEASPRERVNVGPEHHGNKKARVRTEIRPSQ